MNDEKRGKFLQQLRNEKGLTQNALSEVLNYSANAISSWENGKSLPSNPDTLIKLSEFFDISIDELMYGERKNKTNSEEIASNMNKVYKEKYKKYKMILSLVIILILMVIIAALLSIYFVFIKGKISSYAIQGESEHFVVDDSSILFTDKITILNFNDIVAKNNEEINKVSLFYVDDNDDTYLVFSGQNDNYYIEENKGYNEYNLHEFRKNKVFVVVEYNGTLKETIDLKLNKRFENNKIFSKNTKKISNEKPTTYVEPSKDFEEFLEKEGFVKTKDGYEKIEGTKRYLYIVEINDIILSDSNDEVEEQISFSIDRDYLSYLYVSETNGIIDEIFSLPEDKNKATEIKLIKENIDYLLYLDEKNQIYQEEE